MRAAKEVEAEAEKKRYTKYDVSNQMPHNTKSKLKWSTDRLAANKSSTVSFVGHKVRKGGKWTEAKNDIYGFSWWKIENEEK